MTTVRLLVDQAGKINVMTFNRTPIRIGRDTSNECRLEFPFVSRNHATIDLRDGRLMLRDERSRQGTWAHERADRLKPARWVDLETLGHAFQIGALHVRVERFEGAPPAMATLSAPMIPFEGAPFGTAPLRPLGGTPGSAAAPPSPPSGDPPTALDPLSPEAIERAVQGSPGWSRHPHRLLWGEFVRRYETLAQGRAQAQADGVFRAGTEDARSDVDGAIVPGRQGR